VVDILEVPSQVSALGERLLAIAAQERPLTSMFSEMVPQVAALFKHTTTVGVHAFEIQLNPLCLGVSNLDRLVPV
jgi:hypothetical protein